MKQLSQNLRTGKLKIDQVPAPGVQPGWVLVKTAHSLISVGTERTKIETGRKSLVGKTLARPKDVQQVLQSAKQSGLKATYEKVKTRLDARSPLGYCAAGTVLAVGEGVDEIQPGDRVACGGATAAHAEIISVPKNLCLMVPDTVSLDAGAFATLGAIALQGIRQADPRLGENVVVIGLGLLGQLTVQMLKAAGCSVLGYDLNSERCDLAVKLGADGAVSSEGALGSHLELLTETRGADAVLITAGTSSDRPVELAGELWREKGAVVVVGAVGLTLPREPYYNKELDFSISRSYGPGRYDPTYEEQGLDYPYGYVRWTERRNMDAFLKLVGTDKVDVTPLITHRYKLEQADDAYDLISGKISESYLGVLFSYDQVATRTKTVVQIGDERLKKGNQIGVSVIGAGNFAQSMLLPQLKNNAQVLLRGVATISPLDTRDVAERFGFDFAASSADEILADPDVDAVVIATRHDTHANLAVRALNSGKAVHLEKPLALTTDELDQVVEAYSQSAIQNQQSSFLLLGFNRRFAPMMREAKEFICQQTEPLAMTYRINAGYIPLDHWTQDPRQGGGRVIGEVCHFIDLMQFFADARVNHVYARALPNQGKYRNDNVAVTLSFENGSVGTLLYTANGDKSFSKEYLEIYGGGKVAVVDDYQNVKLISNGKIKRSRQGARDKGHQAEMKAWVAAICTGQTEPVPFDMAVSATQATFAVLQSLAENRAVEVV